MRFLNYKILGVCASAAAAAILLHTPASAQSTVTTDDIICQMSGTCGASSASPSGDKQSIGDEKMFSLQKAQAAPTSPGNPAPAKVTAAPPSSSGKKPSYYTATSTSRKVYQAPQPTGQMTMQVHFLLGSAELTPDARAELAKYVQALQSPQLSAMKFVIEGHTDSTGSYTTNMDLSQRRAQSVVDFLTANGVPADRLQAKGYGPDRPLQGYLRTSALNRRVELVRAD